MAKQHRKRDLGIPEARVALEQVRLRFAHRILAVDEEHPLVHQTARRPFPWGRGWGYAIYEGRMKIAQGKGCLGIAGVLDGEVKGTRNGLACAYRSYPGRTIHVCLDNTIVIQGLTGKIQPTHRKHSCPSKNWPAWQPYRPIRFPGTKG